MKNRVRSTQDYAEKLGLFTIELKNNLLKNSSDTNKFIKIIRKNWSNSVLKSTLVSNDENFLDMICQTFAFVSFWIFLNYNNTQKKLSEFRILNNDNDIYTFDKSFDFIFDFQKGIPLKIVQILIKPMEKFLQTLPPIKCEPPSKFMTTFYADFLRYYNSDLAKDLGVVYSPPEIVDYIIRGIDYFLHNEFNIAGGLGSRNLFNSDKNNNISILEPSAGTMAFLIGILRHITEKKNLKSSDFQDWVKSFFLQNTIAIELIPAPFVLGYVKFIKSLQEIIDDQTSNIFKLHDRIQIQLGNTLDDEHYKKWLNDSKKKSEMKSIEIILGNPPYNINTQNDSKWIRTLINDYKKDLNEKNLKILSDDYVKFIRFAQWKIEKTGIGIVAFITNNNYLDGAVFKIMRKSLMSTFNKIYVVDLHGNMRKGESGNPFNIMVGVSIVFLLKTDENYKINSQKINDFQVLGEKCSVFYLDIKKSKLIEKYYELNKPFSNEVFIKVPPTPDYYFIPKEIDKEMRYYEFSAITDLFNAKPRSGIMTGRDALVSNPDYMLLIENIELFFNRKFEDLAKIGVKIRKTKNWGPEKALQHSSIAKAKKSIIKYNYRGMDVRYLIYDNTLVEGCRLGYLDKISIDNPAIAVTRSIRSSHFSHALIIKNPPEKCFLAVKDSSYVFPLKLEDNSKKFNINIPKLRFKVDEELVFYYIYGILCSNIYRKRYDSQLKRHFPRIPYPKSDQIEKNKFHFYEMSILGKNLAEIQLGKKKKMDNDVTFIGNKGNLIINNPIYIPEEQKITLYNSLKNEDNNIIIAGITEQMWNYEIGSIQQIKQWLKSREFVDPKKVVNNKRIKRHKGLRRGLTKEELTEFLELCSIIKKTIEILPKIDEIYKKIDTTD